MWKPGNKRYSQKHKRGILTSSAPRYARGYAKLHLPLHSVDVSLHFLATLVSSAHHRPHYVTDSVLLFIYLYSTRKIKEWPPREGIDPWAKRVGQGRCGPARWLSPLFFSLACFVLPFHFLTSSFAALKTLFSRYTFRTSQLGLFIVPSRMFRFAQLLLRHFFPLSLLCRFYPRPLALLKVSSMHSPRHFWGDS